MAEILISGSDMVVVVNNVYDPLNILTFGEISVPTTAYFTLYSNTAYSSAVSGATALSLTLFTGQTVVPVRFYAIIPSTVTLTMGTTYYGAATLVCTDATDSSTATRIIRGPVTVRNPV